MTRTPPLESVVRTDADLLALWQQLMGAGGFGTRSLWLLFLGGDGRPEPVIVPIDDLPPRPHSVRAAEPSTTFARSASVARAHAPFVRALGEIVAGLTGTAEVASVAMLLSRPGPRHMTEDDRCWARALAPIATAWPIHLATADAVRVFAPDDLLPSDVA